MALLGYGLSIFLSLQMGQPTDVYLVRDDARLDLRTSHSLDGRRVGAPKKKIDVLLAGRPLRLRAVRDEVLSFQLVVAGKPGPRRLQFNGLFD